MIAKAVCGTVTYKKGDMATIVLENSKKVKIHNDILLAGDKCYVTFDRTTGKIAHIWREVDINSTNENNKESKPEKHELDSIGEELEFSRLQEGE